MTDQISNFGSPDSPQEMDWEALARHMAGESSPEDSARIESALASQPANQKMLDTLNRAMTTMRSGIPADLDVEGALAKVTARRNAPDVVSLDAHRERKLAEAETARRSPIPMPALAAAALFAVGIASYMAYSHRPREIAAVPAPRMLATGVGARDSMTLSDGTRVILGPLSAVTVDAGYGSGSRKVEVRGDAWFSVVHDAAKPFTVRAANAQIVDVGTTFTVKSDAPDGVTVSVTEGSVALQQVNTKTGQSVILRAGDRGLLRPGGESLASRGAATEDDAAWLKGRLVFREATIGEIASSMRKWYGIELRVADPSLANRHLTASFAGESPDRVLEVIRLALGANIERRGDTAIVTEPKGSMRTK